MKKELRNFIVARYRLATDADDAAVRAHLESIQRTEDQEKSDMEAIHAAFPPAPAEPGNITDAVNAAMDAARAEESARISAIRAAFGSDFPDVCERCISGGMNVADAQGELVKAMREARPTAGSVAIINASGSSNIGELIQAAALISGGMPLGNVVKATSEKTVESAEKQFRHGITLGRMILEAAWANGCVERTINAGNWYDVTAAACGVRAGYSNVNLPGIFSNIANKFLLDGFGYVDQSWRQIAAISGVGDFKEVTRYRLGTDFKFQKVAQSGELKHGNVSETSYKNAAETYGMMIAVTRQDIINDDLGALTRLPSEIGMAAGRSFNEVFWKEFLNNSDFFKSANGNILTGSDNILGVTGLTAAVKMFRKMKDESKNLLGIVPSLLLVGPSNEVTADKLYNDTMLIASGVGSAEKLVTNGNPHSRKYKPVVSPYLEDTEYTGNSESAYYLLGDPRVRAVIEAVFLNGMQNPVIESSAAEFNTLGIQMRGYMDFGVRKQDPKAGIKITGAN